MITQKAAPNDYRFNKEIYTIFFIAGLDLKFFDYGIYALIMKYAHLYILYTESIKR